MDFVTLEVQDSIGIVTINRPPVNATNTQLYQEIDTMFKSINGMDTVNAVILRSGGKHFMAGNELNELGQLNRSSILDYRDMVKNSMGAVYGCRVPVIGVVNGAALGAGLGFAACCDIIIASEDAFFGLPEVKIGFISASGFLSLLVPSKVVRYMALTGRSIDAQTMMKYGAVHKVVPSEKLMEAAMEVVDELLANSPLIQQYFKRALLTNANARLADQSDVEWGLSSDLLKSEDYSEAKAAFIQHRQPVYKGK
jgi:Enoyl-CoA hydratase/carnithine racemase